MNPNGCSTCCPYSATAVRTLATADGVLALLKDFEGTFKNWRYMHEHSELAFHEGNMVAVIRAVYDSIARLRPDFGPWPGVIVDPKRPVPWHLTPR